MNLLKLSLALTCQCQCNDNCSNCSCISVCIKVCTRVCESVGATGTWATTGTPKLTATFWSSLKSVVDSWLANWAFVSSPAAVTAGAKVLASDWNTKIRDPLNQATMSYNTSTGVLTTGITLGVATAVTGEAVGKSGTKSADAVAKANSRKCTTVYASMVYATTCYTNLGCNCQGQCDCNGS